MESFADFGFGEAVAGQQFEFCDVTLQLFVDLVGTRTEGGDIIFGRRTRNNRLHVTILSVLSEHTDVCGHDPPSGFGTHPGLALTAHFGATFALKLNIGSGKVNAISRDDRL